MDAQTIARIMQANKLTDVMVGALFTGEEGKPVQAGPQQIKPLSQRDLIDPETLTLTLRGETVLHALKGSELSEEESELVYPAVPVSSGERYFVDWSAETADSMIRPMSEAVNGEASLSWAEAKMQVIDYATVGITARRELIKATRSLRKIDVQDETEPAGEVDTDAQV